MNETLSTHQRLALAVVGAKIRLEELRSEMSTLNAFIGAASTLNAQNGQAEKRQPGRHRDTPTVALSGPKTTKPTRQISPAGRRRIAAAQRKRWKLKRATAVAPQGTP